MESKDLKKENFAEQLSQYENKWVALQGDKVIAAGNSPKEVKQNADKTGVQKYSFYLVPSSSVSFIPNL